MRVVFIRHGQSTGNIGLPSVDHASIELTPTGWQQAREVAANWTERPTLIVTSPFLRAQQTAAPTKERFPDVPLVTWAIQEFTYLTPGRWNGTMSAERLPSIDRYWSAADPEYCDGDGAESFTALLWRAEAALLRLQMMPKTALVYLFSHAQFIRAVCSLVLAPGTPARERMTGFGGWSSAPTLRNAERMAFIYDEHFWSLERRGVSE